MSNISTLEFDDIKSKIIEFLKRDAYYKDFNFEASNISRIINMDALTTMYNGYYMKMLLDESMPDSAKTKTALIAHGNNKNYLTKFISASKATVNVSVDAAVVDPTTPYIMINRGHNFKGVDKNGKSIYFMAAYDNSLYIDGDKYIGEDFMLIQGQMRSQNYRIDSLNLSYEINDPFCDESTISVFLKTSKDALDGIEHTRAENFYDSNPSGLVYFITASTSGIYQIHFGRDVFGREPKIGEFIEIKYVKTDGASANDATMFTPILSKTAQTEKTNINFYAANAITINTLEQSTGGLDDVSVDELRFSVVNHSKIRGRVVTPDDIKTVIMSEYRDVDSINVWSGGNSMFRRYGKTYICIKPKTNDRLTLTGKNIISDLLVNKYGVLSKTDLFFVDPNYTDIIIKFKFKINKATTSENSSTIKSRIERNVMAFNSELLSKFTANYYDSDLVTYVKNLDLSIITGYTEKTLHKTLNLNGNTGTFKLYYGNTIKNLSSTDFKYGNLNCKFVGLSDGVINIVNVETNDVVVVNGGTVDYETGYVEISVPTFANVDDLTIIANPVYPDVETLEDNIVRIKKVVAEEIL